MMKIYRSAAECPSSLRFDLTAGPIETAILDQVGSSIHILEGDWDSLIAPILLGRVDWEHHGMVQTPKSDWGPVLDDIKRLVPRIQQCETVAELEIEMQRARLLGVGSTKGSFQNELKVMIAFYNDFFEWVTDKFLEHESIAIYGL
jgi:hypothetical protein